jgi:hypothetical protein
MFRLAKVGMTGLHMYLCYFTSHPHLWSNGKRARIECSRSWVSSRGRIKHKIIRKITKLVFAADKSTVVLFKGSSKIALAENVVKHNQYI